MWKNFDLKTYAHQQDLNGYRVVEGQEYISTRTLVDTNDEHDLLEIMVENSKPPKADCSFPNDYLLSTPFRYPPLRNATRFGKMTERSPFYASEELKAALAEKANRIEQFDKDTEATFPNRNLSYTSFKFAANANICLNVLEPPFDAYKHKIHDPNSYDASQSLGSEMRDCKVQACIFESTRCPPARNIVIFDPSIFTQESYEHKQWSCLIGQMEITFVIGREKKFTFERHA